MNKSIPMPIDISVDVSKEEELFFSITNNRGYILLANTTFCKISGYSIDELKGMPHNVVRHPDMPKIIFHLLWDTIKSGQPFGGYVKNLASDGKYYWVYALVVPVEQNYLSIRILPRTQNIQSLERLYQRLSNIEKNSISEAEKELNHWILEKDFINYHAWASSCLASEIDANIAISTRAFPDRLERLAFRPNTKHDLIANQTLNQLFKGFKFMHRNVGDWLRKIDLAIEMLCDFQAILMVLNRELSKKSRAIMGTTKPILSDESDEFRLMENYRSNQKFLFEVLKRSQFHRSSVLLHLSSMNTFVANFFDYLKAESSVNVPMVIDSIESLKTLTKSMLYFPRSTLKDKEEISAQIKNHFECVERILIHCQNSEVGIENLNKLVLESKEKGTALLKHYESFDSKTLAEASNFYQLLISGELVLEGVTNNAG